MTLPWGQNYTLSVTKGCIILVGVVDEKYNAYIVLLDLDCHGISLDLAFPRLALESWLMQEPKIESESLVREPSLEGSNALSMWLWKKMKYFFWMFVWTDFDHPAPFLKRKKYKYILRQSSEA